MKRTELCVVSLLSLIWFVEAQATLIDNGTYTTDTESGLDWLDVTGTTNQSINYVLSQLGPGGIYEGWHYATIAEVEDFWTHAGGSGVYDNTWSVENQGLYASLSPLWGSTFGTLTDGYVSAALADPINPISTYVHLASIVDWSYYEESATMDRVSTFWHMRVDLEYVNQGHALIRSTVPEPSTLSLLALGLVGITFIRRRPHHVRLAKRS